LLDPLRWFGGTFRVSAAIALAAEQAPDLRAPKSLMAFDRDFNRTAKN
jgi:hypothetical protein